MFKNEEASFLGEMMKIKCLFFLILLLATRLHADSAPTVGTWGNVRATDGHITMCSDSMLHASGLDVCPKNLTGPIQNGILVEPSFSNAATGANGILVAPKIKAGSGHLPNVNCVTIKAPSPGAGAGYAHGWGLYIDNMTGSDSGAGGLFVHDKAQFGDTANCQKLLQLGGGINKHGIFLNVSRQLADTDYVLFFDLSGNLHDTLPLLASAIGREYWFIQYNSTAVGKLTIVAHAGDKIESYDSLRMQSNTGISYMCLIDLGSKWKVTYRHEEGVFTANLTGDSGTVADTGTYVMDNLLDFFVTIRALKGTSNSTSTGIGGFNSNFTNSTLDTSQITNWSGPATDNGNSVLGTCVLPLTGANATCFKVSSTLLSWTATGAKGFGYRVWFLYRLPIPATYN